MKRACVSTSTRMTKASARGELQLINWKARLFRLSFVDVLVWNVWREVRHLELLVVTCRWLHCLGRRVVSCESSLGVGLAVQVTNLVDPASSHMLVSKIKPCMSQNKSLYVESANGSLKQLLFT